MTTNLVAGGVSNAAVALHGSKAVNVVLEGESDLLSGEVDFVARLEVSLSVEHPEGDALGVGFDGHTKLLLLVGVEETSEGVGVKPGVFADLNGGAGTDTLDRGQGSSERLQAVHVRICHSQNVRKVITKVLILRSCHIVHLNVNTTVSSIPPTNLPYIKTAMMKSAPLSREKPSNHGRLIRRVGRNAEQEHLAVGVAGNKSDSVAVPSLELSVE